MSTPPKPNDECFWGLSGQIVKAIAPHTEADPMALMSQLLTAFGNILGRDPHFKAEADRHGCNLFVLNVGNSSKGRKGTSWGQVKNILSNVDSPWVEKSISGGIGSGEALIWKLRDEPMVTSLAPECDKRLLIVESEFGGFLKIVNREGNTTSPTFRNAWDGVTLRNITKGTALEASNHQVSVIGHITMTELIQLLRQTEVMNGLANRFLFFFVQRAGVKPFGGSPPAEDVKMMANEVNESILFSKNIGEMKRTAEADELWTEIYPTISEGLPGIVGSLSSRSEAQVMRLAMIISIFNRQHQIGIEPLRAALAIHEYCLDSLKFVFGSKLGLPFADKLYDFVCSFEQGVTRTQVRDFFQRNCPRDSVEDAIRSLSDAKLIEILQVPSNGGRPTEILRQVKSDKIWQHQESNDKNDKRLMSYKSYDQGVL